MGVLKVVGVMGMMQTVLVSADDDTLPLGEGDT
jgi:hypothetical protein